MSEPLATISGDLTTPNVRMISSRKNYRFVLKLKRRRLAVLNEPRVG